MICEEKVNELTEKQGGRFWLLAALEIPKRVPSSAAVALSLCHRSSKATGARTQGRRADKNARQLILLHVETTAPDRFSA